MSRRRDADRRDDAELRGSARVLEALLDAIPDVIGLQDRHHRVIRYNEAGYRFLGITPEKAAGLRCFEVIGRDRPCEVCATTEVYETKQPAKVSRHVPEMGVDLDVRAYPILDDSGELVGVVEHLRDVTEERRLEERLRQMEKLETLGQLAGGVAHDFNNLLSPILGYADLLLDDVGPRDPRRAQLEVIRDAAERARALTRQLLAFSHRQVLAFEPVDVSELLVGAERIVRRVIREDIAVVVRPPEAPLHVRAAASQLQQVLLNLAANARDAMDRGGTIEIEAAAVTLPRDGGAGWPEVAPGRYALLRCSDTGHGMDPKTLERAFEPFFTTKEVGRGTGLGLATAYGVVAQHGGAIWATSAVGVGTTFSILIPAAEGLPASERPRAPPRATAAAGETVLVVEDEVSVRTLVARLLARAGYRAVVSSSPEECLATIERGELRPDLLLTDVVMPGMSGPELYARLRATDPSIRVVFMSGYPRGELVRFGLAADAIHLLQKPFTHDALAEKIREALAEP